tara:strand:- start:49 stop:486 length:438 start_codon:yes stop_codon:yes gene_type:complete
MSKYFSFCVYFLILFLISFKSSYGQDFTLTQTIKWSIGTEIQTPEGIIKTLGVDGAYIDSRGHKGLIACVGSIGDVLKADCNLKDEDGDISYLDAYREIGGADGVSKMSGGTGKYQNVSANCVYQIAASNQNVSVGLVTMQCKNN